MVANSTVIFWNFKNKKNYPKNRFYLRMQNIIMTSSFY